MSSSSAEAVHAIKCATEAGIESAATTTPLCRSDQLLNTTPRPKAPRQRHLRNGGRCNGNIASPIELMLRLPWTSPAQSRRLHDRALGHRGSSRFPHQRCSPEPPNDLRRSHYNALAVTTPPWRFRRPRLGLRRHAASGVADRSSAKSPRIAEKRLLVLLTESLWSFTKAFVSDSLHNAGSIVSLVGVLVSTDPRPGRQSFGVSPLSHGGDGGQCGCGPACEGLIVMCR